MPQGSQHQCNKKLVNHVSACMVMVMMMIKQCGLSLICLKRCLSSSVNFEKERAHQHLNTQIDYLRVSRILGFWVPMWHVGKHEDISQHCPKTPGELTLASYRATINYHQQSTSIESTRLHKHQKQSANHQEWLAKCFQTLVAKG